jgi:DNA polymerase-3 subunit delta'
VSWEHIQGHEAHVRAFRRAAERGRLAHAYLFTGPPGVGKRRFARELAGAILCENPTGPVEACGTCGACTLLAAGNHPDFFAVGRPAESNELPIEVMRELCHGFALKPARGRGKVAVLDDADDLNEEAANCFLKTLEEPPPRSVFILIGTSPERQLTTIVSRCQVVRFAPLPEPVVKDILRRQGVEDGQMVSRLVRLAPGSPGQAMALAEPELWDFRKVLVEGLLQPRPDTAALAKRWMEFVEEAGKESAHQRRRAVLVLRLLIEFFADALTVTLGGAPRLGEGQELGLLQKLAQRIDPERVLRVLERCLEADVQTGRYVQLVLILEALVDALGAQLAST